MIKAKNEELAIQPFVQLNDAYKSATKHKPGSDKREKETETVMAIRREAQKDDEFFNANVPIAKRALANRIATAENRAINPILDT